MSVAPNSIRLRLAIRGAVQGVGFRPFVFRLATELGLKGWVNNSALGVFVEVEGERACVEEFLARLGPEKPPHSFIQSLESSWLDPVGYAAFEIRESDARGAKAALVLPDIAPCEDCLREMFDPRDRRHRYPFTNCTNCGPRFSIIEALPYDRPNTTMRRFTMCARCQAEYDDSRDRRFHAQPNACPDCGPHLELWDGEGRGLASCDDALAAAACAIRDGAIVAVKGVGGFHLVVDARSDDAVRRLRERKHREEKPLAVMFPSLATVEAHCEVSPLEARVLGAPEAPIVLLRCRAPLAPSVAPGNPNLGAMLPSTPLHHLLLAELGFPVVATSGNLSDEPICTDEREALQRLGGIADVFLVHDRPIVRHVDDSIVRVMLGRELVLRRARGYAPLPITLRHPPASALAVGAHLKNTVARSVGPNVFVSQHIGDLETTAAFEAFRRVITDFRRLYEAAPAVVAADMHPDYLSTKFAQQTGLPLVRVQHHYAHALSCMAENELEPPVLGVAWDGTGYGTDGTIWGGEFLRITENGFERVAHLRPFRLPGGEAAVKEPRRCALGVLYEIFGEQVALGGFTPAELRTLKSMLRGGTNCPVTTSAGRLFDAVAALAGLRQVARFEGQAAMELEFAVRATDEAYRVHLTGAVLDWEPMIRAILEDEPACVPGRFHNTLVEAILLVARAVGEERVVLSGGCFQNRYLTERAVRRLEADGFRPYWHQRVPPNDGGIALGQIVAASRHARSTEAE